MTAHLKGQAITQSTLSIYCIYLLLTEQNLLDLGSISRMPQLVEQQAQVVCGGPVSKKEQFQQWVLRATGTFTRSVLGVCLTQDQP